MRPLHSIKRFIRYNLIRIKRLSGDPRALAGGIAIGVLIGLSPTMPLHTPLIIILALATRTSVLAGIIVSWLVCNPLTFFPIYYISVILGNYLTPYEINIQMVQQLLTQLTEGGGFQASINTLASLGLEAIIVLLVGGFVFSLPFSFLSYYLAIPFFEKRQQRKLKSRSEAINTL
ncbi:MAG: hypothetical protein COA36_05070 [Desulfotalea sp.]|nr:MAG: hypothetical protein COA36_05070 [Desulfotalea sp.]